MGRTVIDFVPGELVCGGGDYGSIHIVATTEASRRTLDEVVAATRFSGCQPGIVLSFEYDDAATPFFEDRHAGRERTPESGVPADAEQPQPGREEGLATS